MPDLNFHLFGKFSALRDSQPLKGLDASKDQQLLSFLLLRRNQYHSREAVAAMFWGDHSTERSKKYLRQSLWHLQSALGSQQNGESSNFLLIEHDWLQVNPSNRPWCDVEEFENAFTAAQGVPATQLSEEQAKQLKHAAALYRDDLLTSWYQDWVLFERERLQNNYLLLLDKLSTYSELNHQYEQGQMYAGNILKYDPARERTHRQLMRLYYLLGDRTAALRQYERCVSALKRELGVSPERRTIDLHQQIKSEQFDPAKVCHTPATVTTTSEPVDLASCLKQIQGMLSAVQQRIQRDLRSLETQSPTHRKKL